MSDINVYLVEPYQVNHGLLEALTALSPVRSTPAEALTLAWRRERAGIKTLGAFDGQRIIGTVSFWVEEKLTRGGLRVAHIEDVAVHPEFQKKGVGKKLFTTLIELINKTGCARALLACDEHLLSYYEQFGFYPDGYCMRLDLNENSTHN